MASATQLHAPAPALDHDRGRLAAGYTQAQRLLELAGVTLFFGLVVLTAATVAVAAQAAPVGRTTAAALVLAALGLALVGADGLSGLVHWAADNWGRADWPLVGSAFIRPFRLHHLDAGDIARHSFLETNGNNCLVSLPTFGAALYAVEASVGGLFWATFWLGLAIWVLGTNQFHAWAHSPAPPRLARWLQRSGLILRPAHHDLHHRAPYNRNYCITNGWLNAPLGALRVFEALEWAITRATGAEAKHHEVGRKISLSAER